ncbi:MAG TPA: hypothetical protein VGA99_14600 [bacterium]
MEGSKWLTRFFWLFYFILLGFCVYGIVNNGVVNIQATFFFFVLLGLFCLPLIINFIPSLDTLKIFGVELTLKKRVEETERNLKDLTEISDEKIKSVIFKVIDEDCLTPQGKELLNDYKKQKNEK